MLHRKKFSASLTRRLSARSPTTVPRGLGSSSDMIAGILSPLSLATALYFPWCRGKCLSIASRGTHGSKKISSRISPRPDPYTARGVHPPVPPSTHFTFLEGWLDVRDLGAVLRSRGAPCPILRAIKFRRVVGSSARRRDASTLLCLRNSKSLKALWASACSRR
jgi:hypothetical protein